MGYFYIILIALGLSVDSFAVSVSCGIKSKINKLKDGAKIALVFGVFQGLMPVIGWTVGMSLKQFIEGIDHWIAFGLLLAIGLKMIYESHIKNEFEEECRVLKKSTLFFLGLATSIDALAVGIGFAFLEIPIVIATLIIGGITIMCSFIGFMIGNKIGHLFEKRMQILGGLILIFIGIKILIEHLS
jgi:putative Mn2+ efflux pump MntP